MKKTIYVAIALVVIALATSCNKEDRFDDVEITSVRVLNNYADMVLDNYSEAHGDAVGMKKAIDAYVDKPTKESLKKARKAWVTARKSYGQTEAFKFYGGPIDNMEYRLNARLLKESYIDYVRDPENGCAAKVGIINNPVKFPEITKDSIASWNKKNADSVASGYHVVEFLLWGKTENVSGGSGSGARPPTDYLVDLLTIPEECTHKIRRRRGIYLKKVAQLIVDDLEDLVDEWSRNGDGKYRAAFFSDQERSMGNIISGIGKLSKGELSVHRITEESSSCFSDSTHIDIIAGVKGIQNVFLGAYGDISGKGIYDLLLFDHEDLAETLKKEIEASVDLAEKIKPPFAREFETQEGQARIQALVASLKAQGDHLAEAGKKLGFVFDPGRID